MNKEINNELVDELDKAKSFLILKDSEAGKYVTTTLVDEKEDIIAELLANYKTLSHIEIITKIANLEAISDLLNKILESEEKVKILKQEYEKENQ
jgi:hypothetical protein